MPDNISNADDSCPAGRDRQHDATSPRPFLRMKPRHFFSTKFDMEIIEDYSKSDAEDHRDTEANWLNRLMKFNLFLLILLVGVPLLVYCILASGT